MPTAGYAQAHRREEAEEAEKAEKPVRALGGFRADLLGQSRQNISQRLTYGADDNRNPEARVARRARDEAPPLQPPSPPEREIKPEVVPKSGSYYLHDTRGRFDDDGERGRGGYRSRRRDDYDRDGERVRPDREREYGDGGRGSRGGPDAWGDADRRRPRDRREGGERE